MGTTPNSSLEPFQRGASAAEPRRELLAGCQPSSRHRLMIASSGLPSRFRAPGNSIKTSRVHSCNRSASSIAAWSGATVGGAGILALSWSFCFRSSTVGGGFSSDSAADSDSAIRLATPTPTPTTTTAADGGGCGGSRRMAAVRGGWRRMAAQDTCWPLKFRPYLHVFFGRSY